MDLKKFTEILSSEKLSNSDNCRYRLLNVTESKVFALDMEDYKPYGFDYAVITEGDTENTVIDFDSKAEMSLFACEKIEEEGFEEFSIASEIDHAVQAEKANFDKTLDEKVIEYTKTLEEEFNTKFNELKTSYEDLAASYKVASDKLDTYQAKEVEEAKKLHENEINALFEKYSAKLSKCAEFLIYKAKTNPADVTVEEVSEKLTLMVGRYMMESQTKKNFSYSPTETKVTEKNNGANAITSRYGHLLDKYIK